MECFSIVGSIYHFNEIVNESAPEQGSTGSVDAESSDSVVGDLVDAEKS